MYSRRIKNTFQKDLSVAQSGNNWRLLMSYFNMIQLIESAGIGLVFGLRFYGRGQLNEADIVAYVKTNALLYEYYKQAREVMPMDIGDRLQDLMDGDAFKIVNTRYLHLVSYLVTKLDLFNWECNGFLTKFFIPF